MSDFVCYKITFKDCKEVLHCIGTSEKDIINSVIEWCERIDKMEFVSDNCYIAVEAAKEANK